MLLDYAEERWAASRPVSPELWMAVKPFQNEPEIASRIAAATSAGRLAEEALA
jgi:hypothetical protein